MTDKSMLEPEVHRAKLSIIGQFTCDFANIEYKRTLQDKWFKKISNDWRFIRTECVPELVLASYNDCSAWAKLKKAPRPYE